MAEHATTNGGQNEPHSEFLSHLTSYPVISDGISTYKEHPYGAKTITLFNSAYTRFDASIYQPVLAPYLRTPYSIVAPYLARADALGHTGLRRIDAHFPVVKEDTATLRAKAQDAAGLPKKLVFDGKDGLVNMYHEEFAKYQEYGYGKLRATTCAIICTELRIMDSLLLMGSAWLLRLERKLKGESEGGNGARGNEDLSEEERRGGREAEGDDEKKKD